MPKTKRWSGERPFGLCAICQDVAPVEKDVGFTFLAYHGEHSCDCEFCTGKCPGSQRSVGVVVALTFDQWQRAKRVNKYRDELFPS